MYFFSRALTPKLKGKVWILNKLIRNSGLTIDVLIFDILCYPKSYIFFFTFIINVPFSITSIDIILDLLLFLFVPLSSVKLPFLINAIISLFCKRLNHLKCLILLSARSLSLNEFLHFLPYLPLYDNLKIR